MCGISGFNFATHSPMWLNWLADSVASLSHRGPDDSAVFFSPDGSAGLGHTRLSIIDLTSAAHQPMLNSTGDVAIVFNGEVYNYKEIREQLESEGYSFYGSSDTEVLLALYLSIRDLSKGRPNRTVISTFLNKLKGIFAFAIWDQSFDSLLLVRDALGVKPLYFRRYSSGMTFASEIKALPLDGLSLDHVALNYYLTYLWNPDESTPANDVSKLAPGSAVWISRGMIEDSFQWYSLPVFRRSHTSSHSLSPRRATSAVEHGLRSAVHRQLISDVPVGAFLSGGLDSSSVVAFAREVIPGLPCFTIEAQCAVHEPSFNDLPYARLVASHLGVPLEVVRVDSTSMAAGLEEMVYQLDEPLADPAPLNVFYISRLARSQGIKVLLSGAGGDDLFTGYRRHQALFTERYWAWLPRRLRKQFSQLTRLTTSNHPSARRLRKALAGANLDSDARLVQYFRWASRSDLHNLYTPSFRNALLRSRQDDPLSLFLEDLPKDTPPIERMLALEQRFFLADHNLVYTDKMSMAAGVEVRVPFLDLDLVELAHSIPSAYKQCGLETKWVLKKAMEPYLPKEVIYRSKCGFGLPLRRWLRVELSDWLSDTLSYDRLRSRGLFDPLAVHQLIEANAVGKIDASYTLLSLLCIEIWCKFFIDSSKPKNSLSF